ncbi:nitroreductase family deazaflavin-dependent oxidoreductase [Solihabitans fulvus]|uniref:Nitroreductase family deazaflavin-dependent oxidoreductase n=1 Tax=Solihabitans fulvus TaxID=1892852 RepID=A0A5B2WWJ6_9PSEU|nr:nitroreductase/quinone reductase family protein [Solihabitans fulvus]KAA2255448.1 nitroreductase family deazaflavin-dependent oxidoreductase [Solihabitans fulvus]
MPNDFNQQVIDEFRANDGRVGGPFEGGRLILLTTTGARSGRPHTNPLAFLPDGGERILVIASSGGAPKHPAWFHNLVANPSVTVEDGVFTYQADAVVLTGDERDEAFARAVEADPGWAAYQAGTSRTLPVVALRRSAGGPPNAASPSAQLMLIHDAFRRELALVRKEIAASGPRLGAQLRVNCLTVCHGLHVHHTGEDAAIFPMLTRAVPELTPTVDRLSAEHEQIAALLGELREVIVAVDAGPGQVLLDVERLIEELERHLTYEEEQLLPILDAAFR